MRDGPKGTISTDELPNGLGVHVSKGQQQMQTNSFLECVGCPVNIWVDVKLFTGERENGNSLETYSVPWILQLHNEIDAPLLLAVANLKSYLIPCVLHNTCQLRYSWVAGIGL